MTKQLRRAIQKQIANLRDLLDADQRKQWLVDNHWKVGTYWKYENSYGSGGKWFLYAKVTGMVSESCVLEVMMFQTDCHGHIEIKPRDTSYLSGFVRISRLEYIRALSALKQAVRTVTES